MLSNSGVDLPDFTDINTGNFFVKKSEASKKFLTKLLSDTKYSRLWYSNSYYHEESAILYSMLNPDYTGIANIKISDIDKIFSIFYDEAENGNCLFFHQCGITQYKNLMKYFYNKVMG